MQIGWIQLLEFRNHRTLSYSPSPKLNVVSGPNARGKTNLLEALGFLASGRSFRTSRLGEIPHWGATSASVSGELRRTDATRTVRRTIERLDSGVWRGVGDDCTWARAVAFGWQDLEIMNGPPVVRRNFLDGFAARLYASHRAALYGQLLRAIAVHRVADRPDRFEPRLKKRRKDYCGWFTKPRAELKRMMAKGTYKK